MASESRRRDPDLIHRLVADCQQFELFQLIRLLRLFATRHPERLRSVRFRTHPSLRFPAAPVMAVRPVPEDADLDAGPLDLEVEVSLAALTGPGGVLPRHYTTKLIRQRNDGDSGIHDFFDLFSGRLVDLLQDAWERSRVALRHERDADDGLTRHLQDLAGLAAPELRDRLAPEITDINLAYYAGILSQYPRSALGLQQVLGDLLGLPVTVRQFHGRWKTLKPASRSRLGPRRQRKAATLGVDAMIGSRFWDSQSALTIRIGPMDQARYRAFLPGGAGVPVLQRMVSRFTAYYLGPHLDVNIQVVLARADVPRLSVAPKPRPDGLPPLLGVSTWLLHRPPDQDADQTILPA